MEAIRRPRKVYVEGQRNRGAFVEQQRIDEAATLGVLVVDLVKDSRIIGFVDTIQLSSNLSIVASGLVD